MNRSKPFQKSVHNKKTVLWWQPQMVRIWFYLCLFWFLSQPKIQLGSTTQTTNPWPRQDSALTNRFKNSPKLSFCLKNFRRNKIQKNLQKNLKAQKRFLDRNSGADHYAKIRLLLFSSVLEIKTSKIGPSEKSAKTGFKRALKLACLFSR